jgi:hypothetical protein
MCIYDTLVILFYWTKQKSTTSLVTETALDKENNPCRRHWLLLLSSHHFPFVQFYRCFFYQYKQKVCTCLFFNDKSNSTYIRRKWLWKYLILSHYVTLAIKWVFTFKWAFVIIRVALTVTKTDTLYFDSENVINNNIIINYISIAPFPEKNQLRALYNDNIS